MTSAPRWRRYLRFWQRDPEADVDDELRTHLELRTAELVQRGLTPSDAERQALDEFGDVEATRASLYAIGHRLARKHERFAWLDSARADLRYALRGLIGSPIVTTAVVLTLAVGIGATATMYGVMRQLLLRPPPHGVAPERMVKLFFTWQDPDGSTSTNERASHAFLEAARAQDSTIYDIVGYLSEQDLPVGSGTGARLASATIVSSGFWRTLGVRPMLGRFIADEEAHAVTGARVAVLGHAFWRQRFGGDREIIGRILDVRGIPYTIIGVAPRGFRGIELTDTDLWLPLRASGDGGTIAPDPRRIMPIGLQLAARLRPGVPITAAEARASSLHSSMWIRESERAYGSRPEMRPRVGVKLAGLTGGLGVAMAPGPTRIPEARVSVWLAWVAGILLAVACANVSGLLLVRALHRRREIAVRLALGMSRRRLAAMLFTEGLVFAILGGVGAIVVVVLGGAWVRGVLIEGMLTESGSTDWVVVLLAAACTLGAALMAGLAPLVQIPGDAMTGLRDGGEHGATRRSALFRGLLVAQTALSVVLLIGAGLFVRSMHRIDGLDHGMDVRNVIALEVDSTGSMRSAAERAAFFERALERARTIPEVMHVTVARYIPLRGAQGGGVFRLAGSDAYVEPGQRAPRVNDVADDFLAATGMRIIQGRDFTAADRSGPRVIVVSDSLARYTWPGRSPIGECVYLTATPIECSMVVGVVANARTFTLREEQRPWFYRPLRAGDTTGSRVLLARIAPNVRGVEASLRRELQELDPALPYLDIRRLGDALDPQIRPWRLGATVFTAFGILAAILAAIGLYAAVAYAVTQRTREIGIRVAVGATPRQVVGMVLGDGGRTAFAGVALGVMIGLAAGPLIADLLFDVSPRDPLVFGVVGVGALVTALLASLGPARRAAAVEPMSALRME